jgi:predicted amidophosphoribosyltransferase
MRGPIDIAATGPVPTHALLVDDVHTTGATLHAAARALKQAGAERVHAVTYARTLRH